MIRVENLTRTYGALTAVNKVSFTINPGEIVGLLGHNGAGKTTIMKMLTGFLEPTSGTITIGNLSLEHDRRAVQALIGYLPENCPVYPEMTVAGYLAYSAALHGIKDAQLGPLLQSCLSRTALTDKAGQQIGTLSRGYRQRVGVAQAILHQPKIIILDEPANGLDPAQIQHMRSLIRELAQSATLIISTHILQEVQAVCDRVMIMQHGQKALDARLDDLNTGQRLLVNMGAVDGADEVLARIAGILQVEPLSAEPGKACYALTGQGAATDLAPVVAAAIASQGWRLYGLAPEARSLEKIFSEMSVPSRREQ